VSDSADNLLKYPIPAGAKIGPGQYFVLDERSFNPTPDNPAPTHFGLSGSRGDDVWLVVPDGSGGVARWVDDVHFDAARDGESFGRVARGSKLLAPLTTVTLGAANAEPRVGPVAISEISYDPGPPSEQARELDSAIQAGDLEFVEIHNPTREPVELSHWRLRGGVDFDFVAGTMLDAEQTLVVLRFDPTSPDNARRLAALQAHYGLGNQVRLVGGYQGGLSNNGESVRLLRPHESADDPTSLTYTLEDQVTYDNLVPWPSEAAGQGQSLARRTLAGWGDWPTSWSASTPSPGMVDAVFDRLGDANDDGQFDGQDLNLVLAAGKYLADQPASWAEGDWNGDGRFDQLDLVLALQRGGFGDA
jgi:hypothetical protein